MVITMKNMKMATIITVSVGFISLIFLALLTVGVGNNVSAALQDNAIGIMTTALEGQSSVIEVYVEEQGVTLREFGKANAVVDLFNHPGDPAYQEAAQVYTERFYTGLPDWEGVYISDWNTQVLAHSNPSAVGMVTRKGDGLAPYLQSMTSSPSGFYNGGAFMSPRFGPIDSQFAYGDF